jgi:putative ABC transport system permease protein
MTFTSAMRVALAALLVNKGRSLLTTLGIVIGIATVIAMLSAGDAAQRELDHILEGAGKNIILIRPRAATQEDFVAVRQALTGEDAEAIRREVGPLLVGVAENQAAPCLTATRWRQRQTLITGMQPELQRIRNWHVTHGRFIAAEDLRKEAPVCVLGQTALRELFPNTPDPVGQTVRIDRVECQVIGVLGPKGRLPIGFDQDDQIFVPLTTLQNRLAGEKKLDLIVTATRSSDDVDLALAEITRVLREQRKLKPDAPTELDINTVRDIAEVAVTATTAMQGLIAVIASISLIVGGVGIMNILLASVAERTREIGLRQAVGATRYSILLQFLLEGLVLALLGGFAGVLLGIGVAAALAYYLGWNMVVTAGMVALAFGVSAAVGIGFSYYPAWRASRLEPIVALRCE